MTLVVLIAAVINGNEIVAVFLALAALILAMLHFSVFEDTWDTQWLNRVDLGLQFLTVIVTIVRFLVISTPK
ncbi:hypothetical protein DY78_GL002613 [Lactiplantibacillus fabifermentans DSM 21115]|uniref:Integral membrane protein n=2 Tax=Lactiplantibacillus fabifermentans TaxID=483011 RepID=A0A0R2NWQ5_9LACO|nr:hypothetical protein DY78_GL002613 [Lactiplantibacillus fabifermentans DSM 21115]